MKDSAPLAPLERIIGLGLQAVSRVMAMTVPMQAELDATV
jgi:hypothetical protein